VIISEIILKVITRDLEDSTFIVIRWQRQQSTTIVSIYLVWSTQIMHTNITCQGPWAEQ